MSGDNSNHLPVAHTNASNSSDLGICHLPPTSKNLALSLILVAICIVTFCGNLFVCATVYIHCALRSTTNYLIVSLALADLLVSLLSMPFRIHFTLRNNNWCLRSNVCGLWIWVDFVACSSSIGSLAAVSIDRFVAVKFPLRYRVLLTKQTRLKMICFVWMYSMIFASLGNYNWTFHAFETFTQCHKNDRVFYTTVASLAFFLPLGIIIGTYTYLTKVAVHQRRRTLTNTVRPEGERPFRRARILHELKAAKMMACVVLIFIASWAPFFILMLSGFWHDRLNIPYAVRDIFVLILPNLNSAINPFMYMAFTRELREQVAKLVERLFCRSCKCHESRVP